MTDVSPNLAAAAKSTRRPEDVAAIRAATAAGWRLDASIGKWRHPESSAVYCDNPRWGRYACEDHGLSSGGTHG